METQATAIIGPVISETMALWGVPGIAAAAAVAAVLWWTKATAGIRGEMATAITRLDARVEALVKERDAAIKEAHDAREEAFKWRESYLSHRFPNQGHQDVAAQTGMDKEQG